MNEMKIIGNGNQVDIGSGSPLVSNVYYSFELRYRDTADNIASSIISPFLFGNIIIPSYIYISSIESLHHDRTTLLID